jgi:ribonuclease VapC
MIVDTSALLAVLFDEPRAREVARLMDGAELHMSTVNLAEALILLVDRQPALAASITSQVLGGPIEFVSPTVEHAQIAAEARARFPLNLGDCFAYALARTEDQPLLTLDRDFRSTDIRLVLSPK